MSVIKNLAVIAVMLSLTISGNAMSTDKKAVKQYNKALESVKDKKFEKAEKWFLKALERDSGFYEAHLELGKLYYSENKLDQAKTQLDMAYKEGGKNAIEAVEYLYGVATKENKLNDRAKYALEKVEAMGDKASANDVGRVDVLAVKLAQAGQFEESKTLYLKLIALQPTYSYGYLNLGKIYLVTHEPQKAYALFQKAVDNSVDNAEIDFSLGGKYHDDKEYKKAVPLLEKAVNAPSTRKATIPMLINCYVELKYYPNALEYCNTFVKEFPDDALASQVKDTAMKIKEHMKAENKGK